MNTAMNRHVTIFFFSGTGNTWWAADELGKIINETGCSARIISVESKECRDSAFIRDCYESSDAIGIAYPIYASTLPQIMWDYMDRLIEARSAMPDLPQRWGFVFTTMALGSGDGALMPVKKLQKAGIVVRGAINLMIDSNLSVPGFRFNPVSKERRSKRLSKARNKLRRFYRIISGGGTWLEGRSLSSRILGGVQRLGVNKFGMDRLLSISVDNESCAKCGICLEHCPMHNFRYDVQKGIIETGDDCIYCLRCYNFCPSYAIMNRGKRTDPHKYIRYRGPTEDFDLNCLH